MGLLRRKEPARPDEALTMLTEQQATTLRSLVRTAFAERGVEVTTYADHVQDSSGAQYGLWNVAATCHGAGSERRWPQVVADHVDLLLRTASTGELLERMTPEQVKENVYLRLYDAQTLPDPSVYGYAEELVPGVIELLAVDHPESISLLSGSDVERLGGAGALWPSALANLRAVGDLEREVFRLPDGTRFDVVLGDSFFTASLALVLPELLQRVAPDVDTSNGLLVCLPFRHQLAFAPVVDASVIPTLSTMVGFALNGYGEAPGGVTPWVYWWRNGMWTQLSGQAEDGQVVVSVPPELAEVLEQVAGSA